jgi:pimeloyl-ACP methyl ester carboxylesterase
MTRYGLGQMIRDSSGKREACAGVENGGVTERGTFKTHDGGAIAVWVDGTGPPLVLVHGSISNHAGHAPLIGELRGDATTFTMDRQGFGASPHAPGYSPERSSPTSRRGRARRWSAWNSSTTFPPPAALIKPLSAVTVQAVAEALFASIDRRPPPRT